MLNVKHYREFMFERKQMTNQRKLLEGGIFFARKFKKLNNTVNACQSTTIFHTRHSLIRIFVLIDHKNVPFNLT